MHIKEYFKDWIKVIDIKILKDTLNSINIKYKQSSVTPLQKDVFKVFNITPYNELKVVIIGQDPYPQKDVATGIPFGNNTSFDNGILSPSLEVIKESVINFELSHNYIIFDPTLESWCKQGVLLLNASLTCEENKPGSHILLWRPFIANLLNNICQYNTGIIYLLLGNQAKTFKPYINQRFNTIIELEHPAYYARKKLKMPHIFDIINKELILKYGESIKWYNEII